MYDHHIYVFRRRRLVRSLSFLRRNKIMLEVKNFQRELGLLRRQRNWDYSNPELTEWRYLDPKYRQYSRSPRAARRFTRDYSVDQPTRRSAPLSAQLSLFN